MMTEEGFIKIINFLTRGVSVLMLRCGLISYIVKINNFCENLLYSKAQIRQTEVKVILSKEVSTKIVNFMTPGQEFLW